MDMAEFYAEWSSESLSMAKAEPEAEWQDAYEETASELLSLANLVRGLDG